MGLLLDNRQCAMLAEMGVRVFLPQCDAAAPVCLPDSATATTAIAATTATTAGSAGSCTGNSATATKLTTSFSDWSTSGVIGNVVGMLAWKNYGNRHVIFDASNGTAPNGVAVNNTNAQNAWSPTYPTLMGWNGGNTFGVRVDSARVADSTTYAAAFTTAVGSAPSYACRAWVNFNGTGTVAIRASGNVSSITDNGVGDYTVNFTTAMPDAYFISLASQNSIGNAFTTAAFINSSSANVVVYQPGGAGRIDSSDISVGITR